MANSSIGKITRICVYCASSGACPAEYHHVAERLGRIIARNRIELIYGGGAKGSMGHLARGALAEGGHVIGVIPRFMYELEWGHEGVPDLRIVNDMHERKRMMISDVDAVVALPGGCGTFEELFEAMAWKRLGLFTGPIIIVNTRDYFRPCLELLDRSIDERFMDERHRAMWTVVATPEEVLDAIRAAPPWDARNRSFAVR
jgi:uncharacterized protein (TIGR00730 family)